MEEKHRQILRRQGPSLVKDMDMDGLLTELKADNVIGDRIAQIIKVSVLHWV